MLQWPLLWKRCHVSLVGSNRNNDKNVWVCSPFCLDTTYCYQTSRLVLFCLYVQKWLNFSKLCNHTTEKRPPASCFYPDSWCSWSYRLNWLRAADFGPSDNNISKDSSALLGQTWLALLSVKQTKTHQHWNLRITQQLVRVELKWEEKQNWR